MVVILSTDHGVLMVVIMEAPLKVLLTHSSWLPGVQIGDKNLATTRYILSRAEKEYKCAVLEYLIGTPLTLLISTFSWSHLLRSTSLFPSNSTHAFGRQLWSCF